MLGGGDPRFSAAVLKPRWGAAGVKACAIGFAGKVGAALPAHQNSGSVRIRTPRSSIVQVECPTR